MVNMQKTCERWFQRFKIGDFNTDKKHGKPPKKYEDVELQVLLDEDDSQIQKQLAEQLSVSQQAISNRLWDGKDSESRQMGATWIERETDGEAQKHGNFARTIQKKVILASYRTGDEKWIFF